QGNNHVSDNQLQRVPSARLKRRLVPGKPQHHGDNPPGQSKHAQPDHDRNVTNIQNPQRPHARAGKQVAIQIRIQVDVQHFQVEHSQNHQHPVQQYQDQQNGGGQIGPSEAVLQVVGDHRYFICENVRSIEPKHSKKSA